RRRAAPAPGRGDHRRAHREPVADAAHHASGLPAARQGASPRQERTCVEPRSGCLRSTTMNASISSLGSSRRFFALSTLALAAVLAGCAVGPTYQLPASAAPAGWKEQPAADGWLPAAPADALDRGEWWKLFGDATLDALAGRVQVSNQNIAAAVANYTQAQALVREQRAGLFPSVSLDGSGRRSGTANGNA